MLAVTVTDNPSMLTVSWGGISPRVSTRGSPSGSEACTTVEAVTVTSTGSDTSSATGERLNVTVMVAGADTRPCASTMVYEKLSWPEPPSESTTRRSSSVTEIDATAPDPKVALVGTEPSEMASPSGSLSFVRGAMVTLVLVT